MLTPSTDLYALPAEPLPWYIEGFVPVGDVTLFGGPPMIGKSMLTLNLLDSLASGRPLFGELSVRRKAKAILLDREVGSHGFRLRIQNYYKEPPPLFHIATASDKETRIKLDVPATLAELTKCLRKERPDVVVFDPLRKFVAGDEDSRTVGLIYDALEGWRTEMPDLSFVIVHHFKQSRGLDQLALENFRGAGALVDFPAIRVTLDKAAPKGKDELWRINMRIHSRHEEDRPDWTLAVRPDFRLVRLDNPQ